MATGSDECGQVTITWSDTVVSGPGSTETITRTWKVTDECGNFATCAQVIDVVDTTAPSIDCPADVTLECPADTSVEANGAATGNDDCGDVTITWTDEIVSGSGETETVTRTWLATEESGRTSRCDQTLDVVDTTAPVVTCGVTAGVLWSPDHRLAHVGWSVDLDEDCDSSGAAASLVVEVWSDETEIPDTGDGTGNHAPDAKDSETSGEGGKMAAST